MAQTMTRGALGRPAQAGGGPQRNPWLVLVVLCTAVFMLLLDTTIVNVAQRKLQEGLNADLTQIQWVLDSYILTYAVFLLSFGRMGDVFGRKRLFMLGMGIFTAASGLCAASAWLGGVLGVSGVAVLIASRVLQGFGGAFMMPQSLSLLTVAFRPQKRGAAMGIWGGIVALGAVCGPIIGGLIVTNYAWEWVFLINLPIGVGAILATRAIVPESVDPLATSRLDWGGLLLSGGGIFALVYASIEGNKEGWTSPLILGLYALSAVLLSAFVWWENRVPDPMMKLELFRQRNFWAGNVIALVVSFGMLGIFFPMTVFLQGVLGFSPIKAGLTMTPMSLALMVAAPLAGRLTDRIGARWILVAGLSLMTLGILTIITRIATGTDWLKLLPALLITGVGMGMTFAPMTAAAMAGVPGRIAGSASGILNTTRNVGQVLGIAVLGSILQSRVAVHAADRLQHANLSQPVRDKLVELIQQSQFDQIAAAIPADQLAKLGGVAWLQRTLPGIITDAFVGGLHNTFLVGALSCALGIACAFLIRNPRRQTAAATAGAAAEAPEAPVIAIAD